MLIPLEGLPTPLAQVANRLNIIGPSNSSDTFLTASYLSEAAIKLIVSTLYSALCLQNPQHAYKLAYDLVRGDGLGVWTTTIDRATSMPLSSFLPPEFSSVLEWATRRRTRPEDEWCREAIACANSILEELGVEYQQTRKESVKSLLNVLVQIRNKTKAHGALGPDFFLVANPQYLRAIELLVSHCPVFRWSWFHLSSRDKKVSVRGVFLDGISPHYMKDTDVADLSAPTDGVYFQPVSKGRLFYCGELLSSTLECQVFGLPNGGYNNGTGLAELIDYSTGKLHSRDLSKFLALPVSLPTSETEGLSTIDIQSNVFGNLPGLPKDYISRPLLETELQEKLCDQNHEIITLHGNGGMGKTYLALSVAHNLSVLGIRRFDNIVWFSARDLDLRLNGPRSVKPDVVTLADVYKKYAKLFDVPSELEYFALLLQGPGDRKSPGTLFIFDNFETMEDLTELHRFLDHHTTSPNKVLLTTRERAFKADYPIEVKGMEKPEALLMINNLASELQIKGILTDEIADSIYEFTKGHPYVMKVILGEMAKERRYVAPAQVLSSRVDIAQAVFERSFAKLSDDARAIFLTLSNWRSLISELALLVVLGQRGMDVEGGIEECLRLSLISQTEQVDGQILYFAPELARLFGKKKLDGDADRLVIQEDIEMVRKFGVITDAKKGGTQSLMVGRFLSWCREEAKQGDITQIKKIDALIETLAILWPNAWLELGRFRRQTGASSDSIDSALRRAVEENPNDREAWQERADYARASGNEAVRTASLVSAVDAAPKDIELLKEAASQLAFYINSQEIPKARRYIFLSSVRSHMQKVAGELDAGGLSRLAWLYLLEGDQVNGRKYAHDQL
jgi:hypothetical protein